MRSAVAIFLILVLTFPFGLRLSVFANYAVHYQRYAQELCENRDQPELKCNGKCQLMKELKAVSPSESNEPEAPKVPSESMVEISPFVVHYFSLSYLFSEPFIAQPQIEEKSFYSFLLDKSVFHPPSRII